MSVSRRVQFALPPNGSQLVGAVLQTLKEDLKQKFREALAFPNATIKIQWSANFQSQPMHHEGEASLVSRTDAPGMSISDLEDKGIETQLEMGSLEIGVPSAQGSVALTRPPQVQSSNLPPPLLESRGRRDPTARRGVGIDFAGGQPASEELANSTNKNDNIGGAVARALEDVPKNEVPLTEVIKEDALAQGMNNLMEEAKTEAEGK